MYKQMKGGIGAKGGRSNPVTPYLCTKQMDEGEETKMEPGGGGGGVFGGVFKPCNPLSMYKTNG